MEKSVREFRIVVARRQHHETAAHPQMSQQRPAVIEIEKYVLSAAMDMIYPGFTQIGREPGRGRTGREAGPQQFGRSYQASTYSLLQSSCDDLNLGQFRHIESNGYARE